MVFHGWKYNNAEVRDLSPRYMRGSPMIYSVRNDIFIEMSFFFQFEVFGRVSFFWDKSAMHWGKTLVRPPRIKIWKALVFLRIKK